MTADDGNLWANVGHKCGQMFAHIYQCWQAVLVCVGTGSEGVLYIIRTNTEKRLSGGTVM